MTSETAVVGPIERWVEAHSSGERSVYVDQLQMCVASVDECGCDVREFAIQQDAIQAELLAALKAMADSFGPLITQSGDQTGLAGYFALGTALIEWFVRRK